MNIELELERALGRVSPPHGFGDRVIDRVRIERDGDQSRRTGGWRRMAAAVLLAAAIGVVGSVSINDLERTAAGERASRELVMAMRIASQKTNLAKQEITTLDRLNERQEKQGDYE